VLNAEELIRCGLGGSDNQRTWMGLWVVPRSALPCSFGDVDGKGGAWNGGWVEEVKSTEEGGG